MPQLEDISFERFGRLLTLEYVGDRSWNCICECGNYKVTKTEYLKAGLTRSCGCLRREAHGCRTHGLSRSPEYKTWQSMLRRCYTSSNKMYPNYGGRGIEVCEAWRDSFECFYTDVGPRPSGDFSLDRYPDNNGNYEPSNVRWATKKEQGRNMRKNRLIEFRGETIPMSEFAERLGMRPGTVANRIYSGWSIERIATTKVHEAWIVNSERT